MAQEREKRRIVIASILKPTDDTRMTEKMGRTLAQSGLYTVTVIGFAPSGHELSDDNLKTISLGRYPRLSFNRWLAKWRILSHALSENPAIFIFTTYELLLPAIVLKVIRNSRVVYDVRENYYLNILHSEGLPVPARIPLALAVRFLEKVIAPAVDHFFLAEKGYEKEFKFYRGGWTVIENKALPVASRLRAPGGGLQLLFTGTLSASSGVFRAIKLAQQCHAQRSDVSLTVAGYAATQSVRARIQERTASLPFIRLVGIDKLVPHAQILQLIQTADAGIIAYEKVPHTVNCVPTKLFEYLQASLPIITEKHWPWVDRFSIHQPFAFCDFETPETASLLQALTSHTFYTTPVHDTRWETEGQRLLEALKNIV